MKLGDLLTEYKELNVGNRYRPVAVGRFGIRAREDIYTKELAKDYSKNKVIHQNTLTVGMGSKQIDIGILTSEDRYSVSPAYHTYRIGEVDCDYLRYCLEARNAEMFKRFAKRGTRQGKTIDLKRWLGYRICLPSKERQATVVQRLAAVERQIDDCKSMRQRLDDLVKSQFVEMFGDTYSNSKQLPSRKLGALIDFITSGSRGWSKYYSDEGDYFITIKNVRGCSISLDNVQHVHAPNNKEAERTKVQSGDVLISITADLGRTGVVSKEIADHGAYINQHLACIRLAGEDILPLYLSFFLESPGAKDQLQRKNQTGVKAGLNFDLVKSLDILVPPLALQQQFADFVARVDKLGFDCCREIVCCGVLFSSMSVSLLCT